MRAAESVALPLVVSPALIRMSPSSPEVVMLRVGEPAVLLLWRVSPSVMVPTEFIVRGPAATETVIGPDAVVVIPALGDCPVEAMLKAPAAFKLSVLFSVRSPTDVRVEVTEEPP